MTARWTDLENSLAAQVATEPTFLTVANPASADGISVPLWPAAVLTVFGGQTIDRKAIAGALHVTKRVLFHVLLSTRLAETAGLPIASSRLQTGGIWDLYDKLQAKLLGFTPPITAAMVATFPCYEEDFHLSDLQVGAVDLDVIYSVDVTLQSPLQ